MSTILFAFLLLNPPSENSVELKIESEFEGGNVLVDRIEGNDVYVRPDLRETNGSWFYWNYKVKGASGQKITFHFPKSNLISARGPAISRDQGKTWNWLGNATRNPQSFSYSFRKNENDVQFCVSIPYTQQDLSLFLKKYEQNPHLRVETLCQSKKNRPVLRLHLGKLDGEPKYRVLLTCRHHACEVIASYALEGIMQTVLAETPQGIWFRNNVDFLVIPFVDHDGVLDGDQGKNRIPRDHNRDYSGASIHSEVEAIREFVPKWSQGKLRFSLDMHCPGLTGKRYNETIYLLENDTPAKENILPFCRILEKQHTPGLPYKAEETLRWGEAWNTSKNFEAGMNASRWAGMQPGNRFASTIEIPYGDVQGTAVTRKLAREFGADIALSIKLFLESF